MNYEQALDYIHSTPKFGKRPGLNRIRALAELMGNPQKQMKFVHITGTNGKGSTSTMITSILRQAGYRVGTFVSPFVDDFRERIQVNGEMISQEDLVREVEEMIPCIHKVKEAGHMQPTEFEMVTAIGLHYFARMKCDFVALEVGMGGTFDCTNIIDAPEVAVITAVSLDHMSILGNTVAEIAQDKCGIIKTGCNAVTFAPQAPEALEVIQRVCRERNVPLSIPDADALEVNICGFFGSDIVYKTLPIHVPLLGEHQIQNAMAVVECAKALQRRGFPITDEHICHGIARTTFPGRLEVVRRNPVCILDGGHNPGAIGVISNFIDQQLCGSRLIAIMGIFADKDYTACIPQIASRADVFIATTCGYPRALDPREIAAIAKQNCSEVYWNEQISTACRLALSIAQPEDVILVCGSLYNIHDARIALSERGK